MNQSENPNSRPNDAPSVKIGVKTPAGMGHVTASTVSTNLRNEKVKRLNPTAGSDHFVALISLRGDGLNSSYRLVLSPSWRKAMGKEQKAVMKATKPVYPHRLEKKVT